MSPASARRSITSWVVPALIIAIAGVLIIMVVTMGGDEQPAANESGDSAPAPEAPAEVQGPEQDFSEVERLDDDDLLAAGPLDAPVVLVVFSDYQCPFCASWNEETLPLLMDHVDNGDLRVEWRDVNVFGPASERASLASYAAAQQGMFWEYHDELFAGGQTRSESELSEDALIDLAEELGLDTAQFTQDMDSDETAEQIQANAQLGLDIGAYSTPAFVLGGQPIVGAQPAEVFLDAFDDALAEE